MVQNKFTIIRRNAPAAAYYALEPPRRTGFNKQTGCTDSAPQTLEFNMRHPFFSGALVAVLTVSRAPSAFAVTPGNPAHAPDSAKIFSQLDTNRDGLWTQQELNDGGKLRFTKADNDKDGFLSQTELANQQLEKMRRHAARKSAEMLERIDTNKDGCPGFDEMQAAASTRMAKGFARVDKENDGALSAEEFAKLRQMGGKKRWDRSKPKTN
jgi:Ca2+-binding EF-hand superfamily protein